MSTNPFVKILSIVTYISIVLHVLVTLALTINSRNKRPTNYKTIDSQTITPGSKYMGFLAQ